MAPTRDIEEASDDIVVVDDEPTHRPCFSRKKKIMIAGINVMVVAVILGVFLSKSKTTVGSTNQLNEASSPYGTVSSSTSEVVESKEESTSTESSTSDNQGDNNADAASAPKKEVTGVSSITAYEGPLPAIVSSRISQLARVTCDPNEILTTLDLVTDGYAWETSWEIKRADGTELAFGPPTGQKYDRMTSYIGELCLPVGRNILVINDSAGDGLCCMYGKGKMMVRSNGETLVETGDEDFKTKEFPFDLFSTGDTGITVDSVASTVLAMATQPANTTTTPMATTTEMVLTTSSTTTASSTAATTTAVATTDAATTAAATTTAAIGTTTTTMAATTTSTSPSSGDYCVTIEVMTDKFSKSETAYAFSSKPTIQAVAPVVYISKAVGDLENEKLYTDTVCVPPGIYELYVEDSFRGLCCSGGQGYYDVKVDGVEILYGGNFATFSGDSVTHEIVVGQGPEMSDRDEEWLVAHNTRREPFHKAEGTVYKPLVWSSALATDAANWVDQVLTDCSTKRESGLVEGENLSFRKVGAPRTSEGPDSILNRWVDLKMGKSYPDNQSLTQAMWRATRYVGCSDKNITYADGSICYASICRYARAGNCAMGQYDDWKVPTLADRTVCGPVCPDDGCH
ncbi:hypothetical protein HJC23_003626 [Cyclotella cryptica]|uniref:SCP domain-containing protein n=1 Tax=Cyclotella cryptica TaxID=29204 RepID=A0ABD3QJ76_9STRA|eukprot:CCRYP_004915-RA/>CCRYP_004915-RA protein AED:0.01 eAED:0.01 QI:420/1/1/1/1/1/2/518/627